MSGRAMSRPLRSCVFAMIQKAIENLDIELPMEISHVKRPPSTDR